MGVLQTTSPSQAGIARNACVQQASDDGAWQRWTCTFGAGGMGLSATGDGCITRVARAGQARGLGLQVGDCIERLADQPFSMEMVSVCRDLGTGYTARIARKLQ